MTAPAVSPAGKARWYYDAGLDTIMLSRNGGAYAPLAAGGGAVTSVAQTVPSDLLAVSGSPITTAGTLAITLPTRAANVIFAGPVSGGVATPTFRSLVVADVPTLNQDTTGLAAKATILATARAINGVNFDGSAPITVTADANTLSGTTLKSTVVSSSLTSVGTPLNIGAAPAYVTGAALLTAGGVTIFPNKIVSPPTSRSVVIDKDQTTPFAARIMSTSGSGWDEPIALNPFGGNVGIGTTTPTLFKLQSAGHVGPDATSTYDLGASATKWRALYASELRVETLVAQNTLATIGGRILVGTTTKLTADLASGATTIFVEQNNLASGDRIYLESAPGGTQQIEFMAVTSGASGSGPYSYAVTRNLDGSGANDWNAGDAVFNTGQTGSGFIDLYSVRGVKSSGELGPTIVGNVRASATYNDWSPRWAIGNLNGLYGYATNIYGAAFGVPTAAWVKIDPTNGVRLGFNATTNVQIDASGNASFTAGSVQISPSSVSIHPTAGYAEEFALYNTTADGAAKIGGLQAGLNTLFLYNGLTSDSAAIFRIFSTGCHVGSLGVGQTGIGVLMTPYTGGVNTFNGYQVSGVSVIDNSRNFSGLAATFTGKVTSAGLVLPDGSSISLANALNSDVDITGHGGTFCFTGGGASCQLGGMKSNSVSGTLVFVQNTTGAAITIMHENASSIAANRFQCPGGVNKVWGVYTTAIFSNLGNNSNRWGVLCI